MRRRTLGLLAIAAVLALTGLALAGDNAAPVTVEGKLLCAKCTLAEEGQEKCQSVVVAGDTKYYLIKNAVAEKDGHVCKGEKAVKVTGVVSEKDGRKWIEATEIAEVKS
ncbi:MAG TPA: DUF6370 family protein [Candidatus Polarisedimenticolaceae bacterium]|nr:DUF6370 family protein [Candidatus Polarisedimenticolaceae bacterium]